MPANYTYKVELEGNTGFILDTDLLDTGVLGYLLTDVTSYVRSVSVRRGKTMSLDEFTAGQMTVVFDNRGRTFDPNYTSSPLYGAIVPRRRLIFSIAFVGDIYYPQFTGYVDQWSFNYDVSTDSTATASCSDAFTILSNQNVTLTTPTAELSGDRINRVLTNSGVAWSNGYTQTGAAFTMGTASYAGNALQYIQDVATSEFGYFFVSQTGDLQFNGWNTFTLSWPAFFKGINFSSNGSGIPMTNIETEYNSDQLYNYVQVQSYAGTAISQNTTSQDAYGITSETFDVVTAGTAQMQTLADYVISNYANPRFRVTSVSVSLDALDATFNNVLSFDIARPAQITFTPNSIGSAIDNYAWIIGKNIDASPGDCNITFNFAGDEYRTAV